MTPSSSTRRMSRSGHVGIGLLVALLVLLLVFGTLVAAVLPIGIAADRRRSRHRRHHAPDRAHGRLPVSRSRRRPGRPRRGHRLRLVRGVPLPREPGRRAWTTHRALATPWAPPARRSSSPAARSSSPPPSWPSPASACSPRSAWPPLSWCPPPWPPPSPCCRHCSALLGDRIDKGRVMRRERPPTSRPRTPPGGASDTGSPDAPGPTCLPPSRPCSPSPHRRWDADRLPRCGRRPRRDDPPTGLRPARRGLRRRHQRAAARSSPTSTTPGVDAAGVRRARPADRRGPRDRLRRRAARLADGDTVVLTATPTTGPAAADTSATIERVRDVIPGNVYVTGVTATTDDLNAQLSDDPAVVHRHRHRRVVPAADAGLPLDRGPAQGGGDEPAVHRRGVRRPRRGLPVGLGQPSCSASRDRRRSPRSSS